MPRTASFKLYTGNNVTITITIHRLMGLSTGECDKAIHVGLTLTRTLTKENYASHHWQ